MMLPTIKDATDRLRFLNKPRRVGTWSETANKKRSHQLDNEASILFSTKAMSQGVLLRAQLSPSQLASL